MFLKSLLCASVLFLTSVSVFAQNLQKIRLEGSSFDTFLILPSGSHRLNQYAAQVERALGVKLVYSPSHLMRGIEGFFSERDQALGISNAMFERQELDSTFYHEVIHASHFRARQKGQVDPLSAVLQVVSHDPDARISETHSGYRRLQTLEEMEAHVESIVRLNDDLKRQVTATESILNSMYQSANEGELLSKQSHYAILLALDSPSWKTPQPGKVREIYFDASAYEVGARYRKIENGARVYWNLARLVSDTELKRKLAEADQLAVSLAPEFKAVRQSMYYLIERVDARKTDLRKVNQAVERLKSVLDGWKRNYSVVAIPRF